jgi:3',5'-cyclic AMP phosphodiesterase CpdA
MFNYLTGEWQVIGRLLRPCTDSFAGSVPFMLVRGNHEARGQYARDLKRHLTYPEDRYYFSFRSGPVYAIVLDTGEDKEDKNPVYGGLVDFDAYRREQASWLAQEVQKPAFKEAGFRVVMMHIPPSKELFAPLFEANRIDLVLSGHIHMYGVHEPRPGVRGYPIVTGGGPTKGNRTLIRVTADEEVLTARILLDDGTEVGTCQVTRRR